MIGVRELAECYGKSLNIGHIAGLAGMLHDVGKLSQSFQVYIRAVAFDAPIFKEDINSQKDTPIGGMEAKNRLRGKVDHSTAGGKLIFEYCHEAIPGGKPNRERAMIAEIVGNAVISHHGTLTDFIDGEGASDYLRRVDEKAIEDYDAIKSNFFDEIMSLSELEAYVACASEEMHAFLSRNKEKKMESLALLTKFVYSMLIDADRTDTRLFEEGKPSKVLTNPKMNLFDVYYNRLSSHLENLKKMPSSANPINQWRTRLSEDCDVFAENPSGIYTLSIPTGGGKTLASLRYALKHAIQYQKSRIFYILPYVTITEQNAGEIKRILADEVNIIEHHSNVLEEPDEDDSDDALIDRAYKLRLARDNWDAQIIFTTLVQYLNAFYDQKNRNTRRLHQLSNAVLIFDEVQKVPTYCIGLFNASLNFLKKNGNSSILLCTATQPALDYVKHQLELNTNAEMVKNLTDVQKAFKRVDIVDAGVFGTEKLADFVVTHFAETKSILVVLNTKHTVQTLYTAIQERFPEETNQVVYHLSTSMCAAHRQVILGSVKEKLALGEPVICVTTALIEAGVDISFKCVVRAMAGLDSIAQAAGRCNRNGESERRTVYVIEHLEENLEKLPEINTGKNASKRLFRSMTRDPGAFGGDVLNTDAMKRYFQDFYGAGGIREKMDYPIPKEKTDAFNLLFAKQKEHHFYPRYCVAQEKPPPLILYSSFKTAARYFQVVDSPTSSVLVPYGDEGRALIATLYNSETVDEWGLFLKRAQRFTIGIYDWQRRQLEANGLLDYNADAEILILSESAYDNHFGLNLEGNSTMREMVF